MKYSIPTAVALAFLTACQTIPEGAATLTGSALAAELTGQRLTIAAPEETAFDGDLVLIADLRRDGSAGMSALVDGEPSRFFDDEESWEVRGQTLCIFDDGGPDDSDCIRVDWIGGGRIQLTDLRTDGARQTSVGTLTPL